jgi:hypothetical protein
MIAISTEPIAELLGLPTRSGRSSCLTDRRWCNTCNRVGNRLRNTAVTPASPVTDSVTAPVTPPVTARFTVMADRRSRSQNRGPARSAQVVAGVSVRRGGYDLQRSEIRLGPMDGLRRTWSSNDGARRPIFPTQGSTTVTNVDGYPLTQIF